MPGGGRPRFGGAPAGGRRDAARTRACRTGPGHAYHLAAPSRGTTGRVVRRTGERRGRRLTAVQPVRRFMSLCEPGGRARSVEEGGDGRGRLPGSSRSPVRGSGGRGPGGRGQVDGAGDRGRSCPRRRHRTARTRRARRERLERRGLGGRRQAAGGRRQAAARVPGRAGSRPRGPCRPARRRRNGRAVRPRPGARVPWNGGGRRRPARGARPAGSGVLRRARSTVPVLGADGPAARRIRSGRRSGPAPRQLASWVAMSARCLPWYSAAARVAWSGPSPPPLGQLVP